MYSTYLATADTKFVLMLWDSYSLMAQELVTAVGAFFQLLDF